MNTPSGYTALDLIGFTDRGAYDSTANYVKNDLTHDLSNKIWRCLIDDTHGVAPAEGVNWTLFIDSQTALSGMSDVQITTPATGEALVYDGTASKWKNELLADVALSGDYDDLMGLPTLGTAAAKDSTNAVTQGSTDLVESGAVYSALADKANTADLATVATSGAYSDLSGTPSLATVATSGSYNDLLNKPTLGTAAAKDSTNAVTQNSTDLVESGAVYTEVNSVKTAFTNNVNNNGSKNILPFKEGKGSQNNVTFSTNANGIVTVNANSAASANTYYMLTHASLDLDYIPFKAGTYVFSVEAVNAGSYISDAQIVQYDPSTGTQTLLLSTTTHEEFTLADDCYLIFRIRVFSGKQPSNTKYYPMVCTKSDYGLDPTYVPYAKTNRQLTQDSVSWEDEAQIGAVNYLANQLTTQIVSPITYTVDGEKKVTVSGTNNTGSVIIRPINSSFILPAGTYKLSGASANVYLQISNTDWSNSLIDYGSGVVFTVDGNTAKMVNIRIENGKTASNDVVKPMITPLDYNGPYVPYAKTNKQLTDDTSPTVSTTDITSAYGTLSSAVLTKRSGVVEMDFIFTATANVPAWTSFITVPDAFGRGYGRYNYCFALKNGATVIPITLVNTGLQLFGVTLAPDDTIRFSLTYISEK